MGEPQHGASVSSTADRNRTVFMRRLAVQRKIQRSLEGTSHEAANRTNKASGLQTPQRDKSSLKSGRERRLNQATNITMLTVMPNV